MKRPAGPRPGRRLPVATSVVPLAAACLLPGSAAAAGTEAAPPVAAPDAACRTAPADSFWHAPVDRLPVHPDSVFDLRSNALRPDGWTSADAAGLAILPGLVRRDEAAAGRIDHAIRVTVPRSDRSHLWPARHQAGSAADPALPPMGLRLRLKGSVATSGLGPQAKAVADALKKYGVIVADNGSPWFISGEENAGWDNAQLDGLKRFKGSDFEAVDASGLRQSPDSGAVAPR
ncbi:hypothetical protein ACFWBI_21965 [Streptomyces sp. NPDC059982]|uniref:hypothetical protein n=1 Tax=unclassified Streptomyces TaxID=2593676 RepID=UPI0036A99643